MPPAPGVVVVAVDALPGMGDVQDIGPEVAAQDVGVGLGRVLVGGTERVLADAVFTAVAAGVGIADELDEAVAEPIGLEEGPLGLEGPERRPTLLCLRPLLDDDPVRLRLALLLLEQDDGGVPVDDDDLVRLRGRLPVDPDIEIVLPRVPGLQGQVAARAALQSKETAPVSETRVRPTKVMRLSAAGTRSRAVAGTTAAASSRAMRIRFIAER